jgi:hypothetical protein
MSAIRDAWNLIISLRLEDHYHLAVWHQWAVLLVLAVAAGFGVHYLLGYVFRFYWRGGRFQWWIAILALPMLMLSTLVLVWSYVLATGAPRLMDRLLLEHAEGRSPLIQEIGAYLLQPAFQGAELDPGASGPTRDQLSQALKAIPQDDLRAALSAIAEPGAAESEPPAEAPASQPPAAEDEPGKVQAAEEDSGEIGPVPVIREIVREWITDPEQSWPKTTDAGEPAQGQEPGGQLSPGEFILSLIGEIPADAALREGDWAYIAGVRFEERLLHLLLLEYFDAAAIAVAILVVLLNLGYFWTLSRMNRPPAAKRPAAPKAAATPSSAPLPPADPLKRDAQGP